MSFILYHSDCLEQLKRLEDDSVDSIVTDPPAGIAFMGADWDKDKGGRAQWIEWMRQVAEQCLRVIKPGGHALVWAIPRTSHWTGHAWEEAGWVPRDKIYHAFGTGFPKSHNLGGEWQGWGTALKPAIEEWWLMRKPLSEGTVAANVLEHGTGAINIDGCRVETDSSVDDPRLGGAGAWKTDKAALNVYEGGYAGKDIASSALGRWPAHFIHDGSDEVAGLFPVTGDKGSAARFFKSCPMDDEAAEVARLMYCAKASKRDRDEGLEGFASKATAFSNQAQAEMKRGNLEHDDGKSGMNRVQMRKNTHATVKPTDLMRYLCRLVTPPGGVVLDPFMGSGSTGKGAMLEGFQFIGIEREAEYLEIAKARIEDASKAKDLFSKEQA